MAGLSPSSLTLAPSPSWGITNTHCELKSACFGPPSPSTSSHALHFAFHISIPPLPSSSLSAINSPFSSHLRPPLCPFRNGTKSCVNHTKVGYGRSGHMRKNTVDTTEKSREPCTTRHGLACVCVCLFSHPRLGKCPCMGIDCHKVLFFFFFHPP